MNPKLYQFLLFTLLLAPVAPALAVKLDLSAAVALIDEEYERYKKRGDDFFKEGKYIEARRQYQNCLEVPAFENDAYAKGQIDKCNTGLTLRQQADEALRQNKGPEAVKVLGQLLAFNADDAITKAQLTDNYEREGNQLFSQKQYVAAKYSYTQALKYTTTRQETLRLQIQAIDRILNPPPSRRVGLKLLTGTVAVGAGAYAFLLRSDMQTKMATLNRVSQTTDPDGDGVINTPAQYQEYDQAYKAAEAAQQKNGLYKACLGVAAVAAITEVYLLVRKPKRRTNALNWGPSTRSWGLALSYSF